MVEPDRPSAAALMARMRKQRQPTVNWDVEETAEVAEEDDESRPGHYRLQDLTRSMCRFATTEWGATTHFFCGAPTDGRPWCPEHHAVCYVASKPRIVTARRV